jgi:hypothetical protein
MSYIQYLAMLATMLRKEPYLFNGGGDGRLWMDW